MHLRLEVEELYNPLSISSDIRRQRSSIIGTVSVDRGPQLQPTKYHSHSESELLLSHSDNTPGQKTTKLVSRLINDKATNYVLFYSIVVKT